MISLIMPAKDAEEYIREAIDSVLKLKGQDWELIVIDDHSADHTYDIVQCYSQNDRRIRVFENSGKGKVQGLNYGYTKTNGNIIKCIDSDDAVTPDLLHELSQLKGLESHCHPAYVTDKNLQFIARYSVNQLILSENHEAVLRNLISLPRWSWSFTRDIADKIFPMPDDLPFEDVWFSLIIKSYSTHIHLSHKPMYLYRQHENQTFGGILNYNPETVLFRANRLLRLIEIIKTEERILQGLNESIFNEIEEYNRLMAMENLGLLNVLRSRQKLTAKMKIVLIKKLPSIARLLTLLKWNLDRKK